MDRWYLMIFVAATVASQSFLVINAYMEDNNDSSSDEDHMSERDHGKEEDLGDASTHPRKHQCNVRKGREANYADRGCETYWECEGWEGVSLHRCPDGGQFDFKAAMCKQNHDVWCEKQFEEWDSKHHEDDDDDYDDESSEEDDKDYDHHRSVHRTMGHGSDNTMNGHKIVRNQDHHFDDIAKWSYVCKSEYGHEPNLNDPHCMSFWECKRYKGIMMECKAGYQYDYKAMSCISRHYVDCHMQHHHHVTTQPKRKVEVKKNMDGTITLVHHYYYDKK